MCTVYGTECIGNVNAVFASQISQSLGKLRIVLGLTVVVTQVLQQQDFARLQCSSLCLCILAYDVLCQDNFLAQQLAQTCSNRCHGKLRLPFALGLAHMGACNYCSILLQQILDGRQRCTDTLVIGDDAASVLSHRDIEVTAQQYLLARYVDVYDTLLIVVHCITLLINWNNVHIEVKT